MNKKTFKLVVYNKSERLVSRGRFVFPGLKETEVLVREGSSALIQIKACQDLEIKSKLPLIDAIENNGGATKKPDLLSHVKPGVPVKKVETDSEASKETPITTKTDSEKAENDKTENEEVKDKVEESKKDSTDKVNESSDKVEETKKDETKKDSEDNKGDSVQCPYCDFKGTKNGMLHHVRLKHKNKYEEYVASVKDTQK